MTQQAGQEFEQTLALQRLAQREGFDWPEVSQRWDRLAEEIGEMQEVAAQGPERLADERGDVLFLVVDLARRYGADPRRALHQANEWG